MKIGQYCQRQRCIGTSNWSNFGRLSRRAGLSAIAGLSCSKSALGLLVVFGRPIKLLVLHYSECRLTFVGHGRHKALFRPIPMFVVCSMVTTDQLYLDRPIISFMAAHDSYVRIRIYA